MVRLNTLAADIHKRMVEDNRFGYSWEERYGATSEEWTVDGVPITIAVGDYDCSSSTITAWRLTLKAAGYPDPLKGATYTGNMKNVFLATGLFRWVDWSQAQRGDLLLNEANHVAMCQGDGLISEFSWGDNGAYGNRRGDQSGSEAKMRGLYNYPWDGCLHYIGTKEIGSTMQERTVWQYSANMTDAQKWTPKWNKDGSFVLVNKACGLALDVKGASTASGAVVQAYPENGTKAQSWKLAQLKGKYKPAGAAPFEIIPLVNEKLRLDVKGASTKDKAAIQTYTANNSNAQWWVILDDGSGWWVIVNVATGKALDVKGGGK